MKSTITLLIFTLLSFNLFSQKSPNRLIKNSKNYFKIGSPDDKFKVGHNQFSYGIYYGLHGSLSDVSINSGKSNALLINTRLFIRPNFGLNLKVGFDQFITKESQLTKASFADLYFDIFYDLGDLLDFQSVNYNIKNEGANFKLLVHGGPGVSSMWNSDFSSPNATDPYFKNHDDILNFNLGISPELRISNHFSIGIDFSVKLNYLQDRSFNYAYENVSQHAKLYALMVGVNYFY